MYSLKIKNEGYFCGILNGVEKKLWLHKGTPI